MHFVLDWKLLCILFIFSGHFICPLSLWLYVPMCRRHISCLLHLCNVITSIGRFAYYHPPPPSRHRLYLQCDRHIELLRCVGAPSFPVHIYKILYRWEFPMSPYRIFSPTVISWWNEYAVNVAANGMRNGGYKYGIWNWCSTSSLILWFFYLAL
jgi:hypothetical protein